MLLLKQLIHNIPPQHVPHSARLGLGKGGTGEKYFNTYCD
jgi:hypothetical protein